MLRSRPGLWLSLALLALAIGGEAAETASRELPPASWKGDSYEVTGLPGRHAITFAYPANKLSRLTWQSAEPLPAGVYRCRLSLRPAHTAGAIAFNSGLQVLVDDQPAADFAGIRFLRVHEPEERVCTVLHATDGVLRITLQARADAAACQKAFEKAAVKGGGLPQLDESVGDGAGAAGEVELETVAAPARMVYYILDGGSLAPVSLSAHVTGVALDKIRYAPGETLNATVTLRDVGGRGGNGTLTFYLEHELQTRDKVGEVAVQLAGPSQTVPFAVKLPARELGYGLVAVYTSADGRDQSEAAEYFTITENCFRTAIFGGYGGIHFTLNTAERMRASAVSARAMYANACEFFAWAEDDMVGMHPATDYWFSGQTGYHMHKEGLQRAIQIGHENGIAMVSYAKFIMSGYLGWRTAYDYPNDHKGQYHYPVGMWEGCNGAVMDRFYNKEFVPYATGPVVKGERVFRPYWQSFLPINPDPTPRMARIAAEEIVRSVEMFGWDAIRWDGHPRGGGGCGGQGDYDHRAARATQTLVRYMKDIIGARYPKFRHGYNYLMVQEKPSNAWAVEDYELDELCRDGGLLMNESIGNTTAGRTFGWLAENLQVEGDLTRERGGYLLGISYATDPRDQLVERILYYAAGCRPMSGVGASDVVLNRYATRHARYVFDETLCRLAKPEAMLKPLADTKLWWQGFVYETRPENGASQLVVNLINIPRDGVTRGNDVNRPTNWEMPPATGPVTFQITPPAGCQVQAAHVIDPFTLTVTQATLNNGQVAVPPVESWKVLVLDLQLTAGASSPADLFGPRKTFGVPRTDMKVARAEPLTLDIKQSIADATRAFAALSPPPPPAAGPKLEELNAEQRNQALLAKADAHQPETSLKGWWKGGTLGADLEQKDRPREWGDLTPQRNGVLDIYYARGALDYRLRLTESFAGLAKFSFRDAPLAGLFRAGGGHYLANAISWQQFPQYDVLLYTGIPHCAIGVDNSYALPAYVKAGGAVWFTGGEYAFGKGGYDFTVLERELLPVRCVENLDVTYSTEPLVLEPGKDFAELGVKLDFAAKPSFWACNQVALKPDPGVKVFLQAGNRPILVGWQLGRGRVACLLTDHRGKSGDGATAFFDWAQWPELVRATLLWLAPDAYRQDPPRAQPTDAAELQRLRGELEGAAVDDLTAIATGEGGGAEDLLPDGAAQAADPGVLQLKDAELAQRVQQLEAAAKGSGPELARLFLDQLATVENLPAATRGRLIDFIIRQPPPDLAAVAKRCVQSRAAAIRENGYQLLAAVGDKDFANLLRSRPDATDTDPLARERYLALGLALYRLPGFQDTARTDVLAWNKQEQAAKLEYTGGKDWSLAATEQPCLDVQVLFRRVACLAYLTQFEPETFGAQFAREWLMTAQYEEYCDITAEGLWFPNMSPTQVRVAKVKSVEWNETRALFSRLQQLTRPAMEALLTKHPALVAEGFARANFMREGRLAINLLGNRPVMETKPVLEPLTKAKLPLLADFASARLAVAK